MKTLTALALVAALPMHTTLSYAEDIASDAPPAVGYLVVGTGVTTNYMVGGSTLSNNKFAVQPFVEYGAPFGGYLGAWASSGIYESYSDNKYEYDLYIGYRNGLTDTLSYDLSFWKYYNDDTGYYGDAYFLNLDYQVNDRFVTGLEWKRDNFFDANLYKLKASYAMNDAWNVSGSYGLNSKAQPYLSGDEKIWDLGVTHQIAPYLSLDARIYQANFADVMTYKEEGTRFVLSAELVTELLN